MWAACTQGEKYSGKITGEMGMIPDFFWNRTVASAHQSMVKTLTPPACSQYDLRIISPKRCQGQEENCFFRMLVFN